LCRQWWRETSATNSQHGMEYLMVSAEQGFASFAGTAGINGMGDGKSETLQDLGTRF